MYIILKHHACLHLFFACFSASLLVVKREQRKNTFSGTMGRIPYSSHNAMLYRLSLQLGPIVQQQQRRRPPQLRLFDCDANLTHDLLKTEISELLSTAARKAYLVAAIVPGSNEKDSVEALQLASNTELYNQTKVRLLSTYGVHPYYARSEIVPESFMTNCKRALADPNVVAVGECGLDQSEGFPPLPGQLAWFRAQLDIACEMQKPLFLHERHAHQLFMNELIQRKHRLPKKLLVHCFTGTESELRAYLDFGCSISISGLICRADKEGKRFRDVISVVSPPSHKLFIETDAPFMQFPGCRRLAKDNIWKSSPNIPASIIQVAEALARVLDRSVDDVCQESFVATEAFFEVSVG